MLEDERSLLLWHLVFLQLEAIEKVLSHRFEERLEERSTEHLRRLVSGKTLALRRYLTVTQPPAHTHMRVTSHYHIQNDEEIQTDLV